jgi:sporulation protein YlmC with PRC-barrel domain
MEVDNARGNNLGEVSDVVLDQKNQFHLVIGFGGFLGMGEREVIVPGDRVALSRDRVVIPQMTDDQLRALPRYDKGKSAGLRSAPDNQPINIRQAPAAEGKPVR